MASFCSYKHTRTISQSLVFSSWVLKGSNCSHKTNFLLHKMREKHTDFVRHHALFVTNFLNFAYTVCACIPMDGLSKQTREVEVSTGGRGFVYCTCKSVRSVFLCKWHHSSVSKQLRMKEDLDYVSGFVLTKIFASNLRNNLFIFIFPEDTGRGDETQGFKRGDMTCLGPRAVTMQWEQR